MLPLDCSRYRQKAFCLRREKSGEVILMQVKWIKLDLELINEKSKRCIFSFNVPHSPLCENILGGTLVAWMLHLYSSLLGIWARADTLKKNRSWNFFLGKGAANFSSGLTKGKPSREQFVTGYYNIVVLLRPVLGFYLRWWQFGKNIGSKNYRGQRVQ